MYQDDIIIYIIVGILAFIVSIYIIRAIFSISKFLKLQGAQLEVLVEIAKQQGVKAEVLLKIHTSNDLLPRAKTNEEKKIEIDDLAKRRSAG